MSCDFHEPYFGADYPDACCIDGFLWDLDSCEVPGGPLHSGGEIPCPQCNHEAWLERFDDQFGNEGYYAASKGLPREYKHVPLRNEQPGDEAKCRAWFEKGYDDCVKENATAP